MENTFHMCIINVPFIIKELVREILKEQNQVELDSKISTFHKRWSITCLSEQNR